MVLALGSIVGSIGVVSAGVEVYPKTTTSQSFAQCPDELEAQGAGLESLGIGIETQGFNHPWQPADAEIRDDVQNALSERFLTV